MSEDDEVSTHHGMVGADWFVMAGPDEDNGGFRLILISNAMEVMVRRDHIESGDRQVFTADEIIQAFEGRLSAANAEVISKGVFDHMFEGLEALDP